MKQDELTLLIAEQRRDDVYRVPGGPNEIRLDALTSTGGCWADAVGVNEDGEIVSFIPRRRGEALGTTIPHGTWGGYCNHRCRCAECRKANTDKTRRRRQKLTPEQLNNHGTEYGYLHYKCRCAACTTAATVARRSRRARVAA